MTDLPMTRRELRELERKASAETGELAVVEATSGDSKPITEFNAVGEFVPAEEFTPSTGPISTEDYITRTGPISLEPTSLVVAAVPDITDLQLVVPQTGELLKTGSIVLPVLKPDTSELVQIQAGMAADAALYNERIESAIAGIEPVPARRHVRSRKRSSVFPTNVRRGWGNVYLVLFTAILSVAVFGVFLAALMLGLIK